jgi:membrane dipeptidase
MDAGSRKPPTVVGRRESSHLRAGWCAIMPHGPEAVYAQAYGEIVAPGAAEEDPVTAPLVFDAHLDLSMNALEWNRDLRWNVDRLRASEEGMSDKPDRGGSTVSFATMRAGRVWLCVATLIARYVSEDNPLPGWHSPEQAWAQTQGQLAWYRAMGESCELCPVTDLASLDDHLARWRPADPVVRGVAEPAGASAARALDAPIGYVLSLEGADSIVSMDHLQRAYGDGLRAIGPAHYGPGRYANGTDSTEGLPERGRELLTEMDRLGMILDVSHLNDACLREALDLYRGPVWASHSNARELVDHNRQLPDWALRELVDRDAVIGISFDAWMLVPGWERGVSTPQQAGVSLEQVADNIDHICSVAGNARHVGIGSDLDGGFGREQCPADVDTIADVGKLVPLLRERGYAAGDAEAIMSGNFVRFLREAWG